MTIPICDTHRKALTTVAKNITVTDILLYYKSWNIECIEATEKNSNGTHPVVILRPEQTLGVIWV
jgi:hypothetical protein